MLSSAADPSVHFGPRVAALWTLDNASAAIIDLSRVLQDFHGFLRLLMERDAQPRLVRLRDVDTEVAAETCGLELLLTLAIVPRFLLLQSLLHELIDVDTLTGVVTVSWTCQLLTVMHRAGAGVQLDLGTVVEV